MSKNPVDTLVSFFYPGAGIKRAAARRVLAQYEAAQPSRLRKFHRDQKSPDLQVQQGAVGIRTLARNLEQNHDIARGALRTLVNNVVGPNGIGIEPQPRRKDGSIHTEYAKALRDAWRDWQLTPEVTQRHHWAKCQRMMAKSWFRDGEAFVQLLAGTVPFLDHGTRVPFSLEMMEADMIPMDYTDTSKGIRQGIQRNTWGKPTGFWVWKAFPVDIGSTLTRTNELKFIPATTMLQLASVDRIGQMRGVGEFASVITRLQDIKEYEESELTAAKVAAALTAYVKRGAPDLYEGPSKSQLDEKGDLIPRELTLAPGTIIDNLAVGEEIGLIDSNRPNPNVVTFRQGQLRAVAAGLGASYSSLARDYNGTYSAQRQELVEQWIHYAILTDEFVGQFVQPVWMQFVRAAHMSGVVRMPPDIEEFSEDDALFVGQSMPWIDPIKEASAWHSLVRDGFASEVEVIRKRGGNPRDVMEQIAAFRIEAKGKDLVFDSDMANDTPPAAPPEPENEDEQKAKEDEQKAVAQLRHQQTLDTIRASASKEGTVIHNHPPHVTLNQGEVRNEITVQPSAAPNVAITNAIPEQQAPVINVAAPVVHVAAPVVNMEAIIPAITDINIVSMPERRTTTEIVRDAKGDIKSSTQVEKDA